MENLRRIDYLAMKKPDKLAKIAKEMYKNAPEHIEEMLEQFVDSEHLASKQEYDECVKKLKWADGRGKGERWCIDEVIRTAEKLAHIDFEIEEFTELDFAYLVNMFFAIFCKVLPAEMTLYLKMAKAVFDYANGENEQLYGDFFKPKKEKHHQKYDNRYENENRRHKYYDDEDDRRYRSEESRHRYRYSDDY